MESKDMAPHDHFSMLRAKRTPLHIDPTNYICRSEDTFSPDSTVSSPSSAVTTQSPLTPLVQPPSLISNTSDSLDIDVDRDPASGPQRTRNSPISGSKSDKEKEKEKRKRSRVTPEQLVHLERFFSVDRSPTAARRREISELLGMQERQTQIWFQNRRAKAKLQDGKQKGRSGSAESPPDTPPELSTGFEADLHNLIHENEPVTIIPCTDLSIGTWRRIATTVGKHDLVAYVCDSKRCLTWFIHSAGYGFKMEIPFENILETEFTNAAPGSGLASFVLSQPPVFYLENVSSPRPDGSVSRHWKRCADWTEGQQASKVFRHDLIGSAVQLAHLLRNLQSSTPGSDIALHSPTYRTRVEEPPLTPMELPQPPMAGLSGPGFHYSSDVLDPPRASHSESGRQRSHSGPSGQGFDVDSRSQRNSPSYHSTPFSQIPNRPSPYSTSPSIFSDYTSSEPHSEYSSVAISHAIAPRPYSAHPRALYAEEPRLVSPYPDSLRRHSSLSSLSHQYESTPSPPLLTQPFHPVTDHRHSEALSSSTPPLISGLPGVLYESDEDLHLREDAS
jgi:regulatory protein PHO2